MIKKILLILFLILLSGCATQSDLLKPARKDVVLDLNKPVISEASNLWWLIVTKDDNGRALEFWIVKDDSLTFIQRSATIVFKDSKTGERIMLNDHYTLTIIRMGTWHHYDFPRESELGN